MRTTTLWLAAAALMFCGAALAQEPNPCSAPFWEPYDGDALVAGLTVSLRANTVVTEDDTFFLKLLGAKDKTLGYIKLTIPEDETGVVVYEFAEPIAAKAIREIELFSPELSVNMTWMRVTGELDGEEYVFFDHECPGVVIGPGGCKRMRVD
jgi:hypothetical protein